MNIQLQHLQHALEAWENYNLSAELSFETRLKLPDLNLISKPMAGSEISEDNKIGRNIKDYRLLRGIIENGKSFSPDQFLPRIPKQFREKVSDISNILEYNGNMTSFLFPKFLSHWLNGKKVCEVIDLEKVNLVDLSEQNFLKHLPYDNFILKINTPLYTGVNRIGTKTNINFGNFYHKFFMVIKEIGKIKILGIQEEINSLEFFSNESKEKAELLLKMLHFKSFNRKHFLKSLQEFNKKPEGNGISLNFLTWEIDIETGNISIINDDFQKNEVTPLQYLQMEAKVRKDLDGKSKKEFFEILRNELPYVALPFFLNGLCKLLAEYQPAEINIISLYDLGTFELEPEISNKEVSSSIQHNVVTEAPCSWYEVPVGGVTYITVKKPKKKGKAVLLMYTGREMPPHLRRKHYRHYRDKDGKVVNTLEIKQLIVRKDKLEKEKFKGSVSTFK